MAYSLSYALDLGTVGLTLKARTTSEGVIAASDLAGTFYPDAAGGYEFRTTAMVDGFRGNVVFYTGTFSVNFASVTVYAQASINPEETEYTDVRAKSVHLGGTTAGTSTEYTASFSLDIGTAALALRSALTSAGTIYATRDTGLGVFYDAGSGGYEFHTALIPRGYRGMIAFYTGTLGSATNFAGVTVYTYASINPQELENADMKTSSIVTGSTTPITPNMCRISGYLYDQQTGRPAVGAQLVATRVPRTAALDSNGVLIGSRKIAVAGVSGLVELDVQQTNTITMLDGSAPQWRISCEAAGLDITTALTSSTYALQTLFT